MCETSDFRPYTIFRANVNDIIMFQMDKDTSETRNENGRRKVPI